MIWVLGVLLGLFVVLAVFLFVALNKALTRIKNLEYFYSDTLVDISHAAGIFDTLVNRRSLLSDDPDVQKIQQVFAVTLNILRDYIEYGKRLTKKEEKDKKKEEKKETVLQ